MGNKAAKDNADAEDDESAQDSTGEADVVESPEEAEFVEQPDVEPADKAQSGQECQPPEATEPERRKNNRRRQNRSRPSQPQPGGDAGLKPSMPPAPELEGRTLESSVPVKRTRPSRETVQAPPQPARTQSANIRQTEGTPGSATAKRHRPRRAYSMGGPTVAGRQRRSNQTSQMSNGTQLSPPARAGKGRNAGRALQATAGATQSAAQAPVNGTAAGPVRRTTRNIYPTNGKGPALTGNAPVAEPGLATSPPHVRPVLAVGQMAPAQTGKAKGRGRASRAKGKAPVPSAGPTAAPVAQATAPPEIAAGPKRTWRGARTPAPHTRAGAPSPAAQGSVVRAVQKGAASLATSARATVGPSPIAPLHLLRGDPAKPAAQGRPPPCIETVPVLGDGQPPQPPLQGSPARMASQGAVAQASGIDARNRPAAGSAQPLLGSTPAKPAAPGNPLRVSAQGAATTLAPSQWAGVGARNKPAAGPAQPFVGNAPGEPAAQRRPAPTGGISLGVGATPASAPAAPVALIATGGEGYGGPPARAAGMSVQNRVAASATQPSAANSPSTPVLQGIQSQTVGSAPGSGAAAPSPPNGAAMQQTPAVAVAAQTVGCGPAKHVLQGIPAPPVWNTPRFAPAAQRDPPNSAGARAIEQEAQRLAGTEVKAAVAQQILRPRTTPVAPAQTLPLPYHTAVPAQASYRPVALAQTPPSSQPQMVPAPA